MYNGSEKDFLIQLASRIKERRKKKKLTQEELARLTGLHRTYIGQLESGQKNISMGVLLKVANALEVSVENLVKYL